MEIEIVDPLQVAVGTMDESVDGGLYDWPDVETRARAVIDRTVVGALVDARERTGIRFLSGGAMIRPQKDGMYLPLTLPASPVDAA